MDATREADPRATETPEVSVVMPCLDEANTVATCVKKALDACRGAGIAAEVVVADNGSTDGSQDLARAAGARVVAVTARGYGSALRGGILAARGRFVVMADSDDSYELADVPRFVEELRKGAQLVMGSRFKGTIHPGAMPILNRYLGNPVLTGVLNLFFRVGITDAHCGMRGFSREAILGLNLQTTGMEYASEQVIRAAQEGLAIREVPTSLRPDGRGRPPHLRRWRDGWRHLRFMLLFSPVWLFTVPGTLALALGLFLLLAVTFVPVTIFGHRLDTHFGLLGSSLSILGAQVVSLGLFAKAVYVLDGLGRAETLRSFLSGFRLETAIVFGIFVSLLGGGIDSWVLAVWIRRSGGGLESSITHLAILGGTLGVLGLQVVFSAFFLSVLKLRAEARS